MRGDRQSALLRVQIHRFKRVAIDAAACVQKVDDAAVAEIGLGRGGVDLGINRQFAAGETRQAFVDEAPARLRPVARDQAGRRDGP